MKKQVLATLFGMMGLLAPVSVYGQVEAFPGAEGYGRMTTGGRGGNVYHVTKLTDDGTEGTFRWACNQKGRRTIVFDVSGTINLSSELRLSNGDVTIAGQSAPGDGICVADYPFTINSSNVIIRYMRFRPGDRFEHEADGLGGMDQSNIIVDHCSVSWSVDECLSVYGSTDISVQWCIVANSLAESNHAKGSHGYGGNWGGRRASYHHNLIANHNSRTPRLGPRTGTQTEEQMDMRNNVIYNYGTNGCYGGEGMNVNIVNNYYKPGPTKNSRKSRIAGIGIRTLDYCIDKSTTAANINKALGTNYTTVTIRRIGGVNGENQLVFGGKIYVIDMASNTIDVDGKKITVAWNGWKPMLHKWGTYYVDGNFNPSDANVTADNWTTGIYSQVTASANDNMWSEEIKQEIKLLTPIDFVYTTTHTAEMAYERVLDYAGTSLSRDIFDRTLVSDVRDGKGSWGTNGIVNHADECVYADGTKGWPVLNSTTPKPDSDGDGMPDEWETANGLNPADPADGKKRASNGFTNLENYLNSLVAHITEAQNQGGKMLTGNLESSDPGVVIPPYVEPDTYDVTLSAQTYLNSTGDATWNFANGYTITNDKNRPYAAGEENCLRYNTNVKYTVSLPEGVTVHGADFRGYHTYSSGDAYFTNFAGQTGTDMFFAPKNGDQIVMSEGNIQLDAPAEGSFDFSVGGHLIYTTITLKVAGGNSAIDDIVVPDERPADNRIFNLMGVEVKAPLVPGIYIQNGKKFVVR